MTGGTPIYGNTQGFQDISGGRKMVLLADFRVIVLWKRCFGSCRHASFYCGNQDLVVRTLMNPICGPNNNASSSQSRILGFQFLLWTWVNNMGEQPLIPWSIHHYSILQIPLGLLPGCYRAATRLLPLPNTHVASPARLSAQPCSSNNSTISWEHWCSTAWCGPWVKTWSPFWMSSCSLNHEKLINLVKYVVFNDVQWCLLVGHGGASKILHLASFTDRSFLPFVLASAAKDQMACSAAWYGRSNGCTSGCRGFKETIQLWNWNTSSSIVI